MEFFIPGLLVLLIAIIISFFVAPKVTPLIAAVASIIFLTFGVYQHYTLFSSEYRLSTWQNGFKVYAPAIMILTILIFIIYAIFAFFTKGSIPIPPMPQMPNIPSANTVSQTFKGSLDNVVESIENVKNNITNTVKNVNANKTNNKTNANKTNNANKNKNKKNSASFLETI